MPCGDKIHIVREKWKREQERREQEEKRRKEETERAVPVPNWPIRAPAKTPASVPEGQSHANPR